MIIIFTIIPEAAYEEVTAAIFSAGAGKMDNYTHCCFATKGIGQFLPLENSNPYLGTKLEVNKVNEIKIETVCTEENYAAVVQALLAAHPYETPYWYAIKPLQISL